MELVQMVQTAATRQPATSKCIQISIGWLGGKALAVEHAINHADNEQKAKFINGLLSILQAANFTDALKSDAAKKELVELFGEEILRHPAVVGSRGGFFFSLSNQGTQFRGWYAPFGSVTCDHFDSCGSGIAFHSSCDSPSALRQWLTAIVGSRIEWQSQFGSVWIGTGRGGFTFR